MNPIYRVLLARETVGATVNSVTSSRVSADVPTIPAIPTASGVIATRNRVAATQVFVAVPANSALLTWANVFAPEDVFATTSGPEIQTADGVKSTAGFVAAIEKGKRLVPE